MKTMRGVRCGLAVVGLMACGIAGARTVYVSPDGDDDNDGASWSSAVKDVGVAYALATNGATAEAPGEVMLAAGLYTLTNSIAMHPYMHVIGATDGETILSGDQGKPDYWRRNNGGNYGTVLQDGAVYLPDYPEDAVSYFSAYDPGFGKGNDKYEDTVHAFVCETNNAPTNVFKNLTFVLFVKAAIWSEGASVEGLTVENCRFYGNNHMACRTYKSDAGTIDLRKGSATIKDCVFRYNDFGVRFDDASGIDTAGRNRVINCRFLNNHATKQHSHSAKHVGTGGVVAKNNSLVDILGCTFYRCAVSSGNNNDADVAAGAVAIAGIGPVGSVNVVSNCTFEGNFMTDAYSAAAALLCTHGDTTHENLIEVMACSFVSNRCQISSGRATSAAISLGRTDGAKGSRLIVRDSYFAYNLHTNAVTSSDWVRSASVFAQSGNSGIPYAAFVNCTIENNVAIAPNVTSADGRCPSTFGMQTGDKDAIINCLIRNNDVLISGRRAPEFFRDNVYNSSDLNIVNTIMTHEADDYKPFADPFLSQRGMILATSVIKNFTWGEDFSTYTHANCTDYGCLITPVKPLTEVSLVLGALQTQGGVTARGVMLGSTRWLRKGGTPVYRGTNNRFYVWNPTSPASATKPWWCLDQHQGKYTDAELEEFGIVRGVTPVVADAYGAARPEGDFGIGPFNSPREGTVLTIK